MNNRIWNSKNPHQSKRRKVLCVCSAGLLRSTTLAFVLTNHPYNCNVRNCGFDIDFALIPLDEVLMEWADIVVCVEANHAEMVKSFYKERNLNKEVLCLDIPDSYGAFDPTLVKIIQNKLGAFGFPMDEDNLVIL